MRASSPRRRGNRGWRRVDYPAEKLAEIGTLLRECGLIGGEGDPTAAHGHYDRLNRLRRLHAAYANGQRATLVQRLDGGYSLSMALKLVIKPGGAE